MSFKSMLRPLETYGFALLSALVAYGYSFPRPNTYNQMPVISSLLDSALLSRDFYIQEMTEFTPRFYYYHLIIFFNKLGLSLPVASFILFALAFGSMVLGFWSIGRYLGRSEFAGLAVAFLGLSVLDGTVGLTSIFRIDPAATAYAMAVTIWGIYFCLRRQWRLGYLMFGLASLLQFLVGFLPGVLWGVSLLFEAVWQRRLGKLLSSLLIFSLFLALVYVPMVATGNTSSDTLTETAFIHLYGYIRHPHHIIMSSFPAKDWWDFCSLIGAGLICLQLSDRLSPAHRRHLLSVLITTCGLLLLGYVLVEQIPIALVAKLQFARATPFAMIATLTTVGIVASEYHHRGNYPVSLLLLALPLIDRVGPRALLVLVALLWMARVGWGQPYLKKLGQLEALKLSRQRHIAIAYALFLMVLLACWSYLPVFFASLSYPLMRRPFPNFFQRSRAFARFAAIGLSIYLGLHLSGGVAYAGLTPLHREIRIYPQTNKSLKQIAAQFRQVSPPDALILVPPSDETFRYYGERSVVVTFKSFPFTDHGILTWQSRLERVLGPVSPRLNSSNYINKLYRQRSSQELTQIAQAYDAGYILTQRPWHPDIEGDIVATVDDWVIWQLPKSDQAPITHRNHIDEGTF